MARKLYYWYHSKTREHNCFNLDMKVFVVLSLYIFNTHNSKTVSKQCSYKIYDSQLMHFLLLLNMLLHFYTAMVILYLYIIAINTPGVLQITLWSVLRSCIPELCKTAMHCYTTRGLITSCQLLNEITTKTNFMSQVSL